METILKILLSFFLMFAALAVEFNAMGSKRMELHLASLLIWGIILYIILKKRK